ncbi:MAG: hypothetical protein KIT17_06840 [Rubrivivax sp.]|nr:hypothetical protein [Rubrivivax sp.]
MLPFTREQFVEVFARYNEAVWPVQVLAYLLGLAAVVLLLSRRAGFDRVVGGVLALMWLWTGVAYHGVFFSAINKAAAAFAALFVVQGLLFARAAVVRGTLRFAPGSGPAAWLGWALVVYAAVLYPLVGMAAGHAYPQIPMFGITPCPVTLLTFGLLLLAAPPVPRSLLVIPFLWSLVGGSAAFLLGVPQDWPLLASGLIALFLFFAHRAPHRTAHA